MSEERQHDEKPKGGEDIPEDIKYTHPSIITVGPIRVDASLLRVSVNGKTLSLTAMESKFLHFLAVHANTVCTVSQIGSQVWGFSNDGDTSLIHVYIRKLRQKVELDPNHPTYILTVPGIGYILVSHDLDKAKQTTSKDVGM